MRCSAIPVADSPTGRRWHRALKGAHINPYGTFHIDMNTHLDFGPGNTPTAKAA
jgi:hypothetical protein